MDLDIKQNTTMLLAIEYSFDFKKWVVEELPADSTEPFVSFYNHEKAAKARVTRRINYIRDWLAEGPPVKLVSFDELRAEMKRRKRAIKKNDEHKAQSNEGAS
jgi:hypothetical protein